MVKNIQGIPISHFEEDVLFGNVNAIVMEELFVVHMISVHAW